VTPRHVALDLRRNGEELLALVSEHGEVRLVDAHGRVGALPFSSLDLSAGERALAQERLDAARALEVRR